MIDDAPRIEGGVAVPWRHCAAWRPSSTLFWQQPWAGDEQEQAKFEQGIYSIIGTESNSPFERNPMAFKPNYGRDRAERQRAARARSEEKQRKKDEKVALRKAERAADEPSPEEEKQG
jgi:hypothetical protein